MAARKFLPPGTARLAHQLAHRRDSDRGDPADLMGCSPRLTGFVPCRNFPPENEHRTKHADAGPETQRKNAERTVALLGNYFRDFRWRVRPVKIERNVMSKDSPKMFQVAAASVLIPGRGGNRLARFSSRSALLGSSLLVVLALGCASNPGGNAGSNHSANAGFSENPRLPAAGVTPATPPGSDLAISKQIYAMFSEDKSLAPAYSNVITSVRAGVVTMSGYAPSTEDLQRIQERIGQLPGVVRVENQATVSLKRRVSN